MAEPTARTDDDDAEPQFGMVDVVEAFTAMRHEWRGQTKESRVMTDAVREAVTAIRELESTLSAAGPSGADDGTAEALAGTVAEIDHQLTRAVAAVGQWARRRADRKAADMRSLEERFGHMNAVARWFARPLLESVRELSAPPEGQAALAEGLDLVVARLRREMRQQGIERLDTPGEPFDATTMNAIGTVETADFPPGTVAEQLAPGYRWRGRLLRYADVRVAKEPAARGSASGPQRR